MTSLNLLEGAPGSRRFWCFVLVLVVLPVSAAAGGISVDTGLTPPEDRWIIRTQLFYMPRQMKSMAMGSKMEVYMLRTVLAYGLRRNLTLMVRQNVNRKNLSMAGMNVRSTGTADLFLMAKLGLYRLNTRSYTFGVAATLGVEVPTGSTEFSGDAWNTRPGLYLSWRRGAWNSDLSMTYTFQDFTGRHPGGIHPGDRLALDLALSRQYPLGNRSELTLAPVLELSYARTRADRASGLNDTLPNTGEEILLVSPGLKYTRFSFILEALVQFPVWRGRGGVLMERGTAFLLGMRAMF